MATKEEVRRDIEQTIGFVPDWLASLPEATFEAEWRILKDRLLGRSAVPNKYKELIGLAVAAHMQCDYCVSLHAEFARYFGATDDEIEDAVQMAKETAGWSAYFNGMQINLDQFKREVREICDTLAAQEKAA